MLSGDQLLTQVTGGGEGPGKIPGSELWLLPDVCVQLLWGTTAPETSCIFSWNSVCGGTFLQSWSLVSVREVFEGSQALWLFCRPWPAKVCRPSFHGRLAC